MSEKKKERAWCKKEIGRAVRLLARRQHDVDSLIAHIKFLKKTRKQAEVDRKLRKDRIAKNLALIAQFKKQRCDNNLLFVKQLKEHMEAINVLKLLRGDIIKYFNAKKKGEQGLGFLQTFSEYSHLLDDTHKQTLVELKAEVSNLRKHKLDRSNESQRSKLADTKKIDAFGDKIAKEKERTTKEIGTGHVDNTRGELKKLATPGFDKIGSFNTKTRTKILGMINGLIAHLRESRKKLTASEIKAAEDFAIFQNSTEKENEYLEEKIAELTKEILDLTNQINVSKVQLVKRKKLRDVAKARLDLLRKICKEKKAYFAKETARRRLEDSYIKSAINIFETKLMHLSKRVRARASGGVKVDEIGHRVVSSEAGVKKHNAALVKEREAVVF